MVEVGEIVETGGGGDVDDAPASGHGIAQQLTRSPEPQLSDVSREGEAGPFKELLYVTLREAEPASDAGRVQTRIGEARGDVIDHSAKPRRFDPAIRLGERELANRIKQMGQQFPHMHVGQRGRRLR